MQVGRGRMDDLNGVIEMIPWAVLGALAILVLFL